MAESMWDYKVLHEDEWNMIFIMEDQLTCHQAEGWVGCELADSGKTVIMFGFPAIQDLFIGLDKGSLHPQKCYDEWPCEIQEELFSM